MTVLRGSAALTPVHIALALFPLACLEVTDPEGHEQVERLTADHADTTSSNTDAVPDFASDADLVAWVYQQEKPEGYLEYRRSIGRTERVLLPRELSLVELIVDASNPGESYRHISDEINVWKPYATLRPSNKMHERMKGGSVEGFSPWWEWARMPAALGGNFCPELAAACNRRQQTTNHDIEPGWECGTEDFESGIAAAYELVLKAFDGEVTYQFNPFREAMEAVLATGLKPHLNISSASSIFTGGKCTMKWYHWNEEPVRDFQLWSDFVYSALREVRDLNIEEWRFSVVNEPNCLISDHGSFSHVGYRGEPEDYARQFVATVTAAHKVDPLLRFQVGNFVVSEAAEEEKNLHRYLRALKSELNRTPELRWEDSNFYSISVYDVPHKSIYGVDAVKFDQFRRYREAVGLSELPIKVDEFDIHPLVFGPYNREHSWPFQYTWHSASWMAKALSVFHEHDVRSAATWFGQVVHFPGGRRKLEPTPRYYVLMMDAMMSGRIELLGHGLIPDMRRRTPGVDGPRYAELSVSGEVKPTYLGEGYNYRSIEATATRSLESDRIFVQVFHHTTVLESDEETLDRPESAQVRLEITGLDPGTYQVRVYGIGVAQAENGPRERWIGWNETDESTTPFLPIWDSSVEVGKDKSMSIHPAGLAGPFSLARHSVVFVDIQGD